MISIAEFETIELRIGRVIAVDDIEKAEKPIYKLTVDLGKELGNRTIAAGIKNIYSKEDLLGKEVVCVANLEPKNIAGILSEGMLLAAEDDATLSLLIPERPVAEGSRVH